MSWTDYTHAKHFGSGIFRPYSDFIAEINLTLDNHIAGDPGLAKNVYPYHERDTLLILGEELSILAISSSKHRQYPLYLTIKWGEFWNVSEKVMIEGNQLSKDSSSLLNLPDLTRALENDHFFKNATVLAFPSVFQSNPKDAGHSFLRNNCIQSAAQILYQIEQTSYEERLEMEKPKEIFLSHKSVDKLLIREIADTLTSIGFAPWLDEDKMNAGANLERSIRDGFTNSCAAVFFITPNFSDEGYLATEIDYALAEKREKGDRFSIITLLIPNQSGEYGEVPRMISQYVWKQVEPLQIVRTIVQALPICITGITWKK